MSLLDVFALLVFMILCGLVWTWFGSYRRHPWREYLPRLAWIRAGIYFCCCYLLSYLSGGLELILTRPIATPEQLATTSWWVVTIGVFAFITFAYAGVWSYFTPVFDRPRNPLISAAFGFLWGSSSGQLFLSIWLLVNETGLQGWGAWFATFLILGAWQPNWHNIYWDHYIAPEHDTPMTQKIKALGCHIPNLAVTLTYVMYNENFLLFVGAQVLACMSAAIGMRFPAPWSPPLSAINYAQRTRARVPRCTGYLPKDPQRDPYTPFYPGWKRAP